jgi:hypothetical protein
VRVVNNQKVRTSTSDSAANTRREKLSVLIAGPPASRLVICFQLYFWENVSIVLAIDYVPYFTAKPNRKLSGVGGLYYF